MKAGNRLLVVAALLLIEVTLAFGQQQQVKPQSLIRFATGNQSRQTSSLHAKGTGKIDKQLLRNGNTGDVALPQSPREQQADIDVATAQRLALVRARHLWGGNPSIGSVVPLCNGAGQLVAYDIDIDMSGQVWKPYATVASDWQRILKEQDTQGRKIKFPGGSENSVSPGDPQNAYASLTISATYDAYPIRSARQGVSNFYASAWVAKRIATEVFGNQSPTLNDIVFLGPWERAYRFASGSRTVVVNGQEPWSWFDGGEYSQAMTEGLTIRKSELDTLLLAHALLPQRFIDSVRLENQKAVDRIMNEPTTPSFVRLHSGTI